MQSKIVTPAYVYSLADVKKSYEKITRALKIFKHARVHYVMKANNRLPILHQLLHIESGIDASSPQEAKHAIQLDFDAEKITLTSIGLTPEDYSIMLPNAPTTVFSFMNEAKKWPAPQDIKIGVRINTLHGLGAMPGVITAGKQSKFGILSQQLSGFIETAQDKGYIIDIVHHHVGSNWRAPVEEYLKALDQLIEAYETVESKTGHSPTTIDLGGGFSIDFDFETFFQNVHDKLSEHGLENKNIIIEPGTAIVASAGVLLVKASTVEKKGRHKLHYCGCRAHRVQLANVLRLQAPYSKRFSESSKNKNVHSRGQYL